MDGAVCYVEEFGGDVTFPECLERKVFCYSLLAVADDEYDFGGGEVHRYALIVKNRFKGLNCSPS